MHTAYMIKQDLKDQLFALALDYHEVADMEAITNEDRNARGSMKFELRCQMDTFLQQIGKSSSITDQNVLRSILDAIMAEAKQAVR